MTSPATPMPDGAAHPGASLASEPMQSEAVAPVTSAAEPTEGTVPADRTARAEHPGRASAVVRWFVTPVPRARLALFRILIAAFLPLEVLWIRTNVIGHAYVPELYRPTWLARALHLPPLSLELSQGLLAAILVLAAASIAATLLGRWQRTIGWLTAAAFWLWMLNSMGFGYVSHDHLALMVAVTVLPTAGRATVHDLTPSERAGWALRCVQLAVVATYVGSAVLKTLRAGTLWGWPNSAVFTWAIMRRGSPLISWTLEYPWLLRLGQWGLFLVEWLSPVVFWLRGRWLYGAIGLFCLFHLATFLSLGIHFLPTVVCWAAFLPLERLPFVRRRPA